jgi:hypothetical protein
MSTPTGMSASPASVSIPLISRTADSIRPALGAIAPRRPSIPARQFSGSSHGAYSWWWRAADPKSHSTGSASPASRAYRVILSPSAPPIQVWVT